MSKFILIIEEDTLLEVKLPTKICQRILSLLLAGLVGLFGTLGISIELKTKLSKDVNSGVLE